MGGGAGSKQNTQKGTIIGEKGWAPLAYAIYLCIYSWRTLALWQHQKLYRHDNRRPPTPTMTSLTNHSSSGKPRRRRPPEADEQMPHARVCLTSHGLQSHIQRHGGCAAHTRLAPAHKYNASTVLNRAIVRVIAVSGTT